MPEAQEKMRITFVIPYFYPSWEYGGQPRSAYELARALATRGHRIKVLTTDSGGKNRLNEVGRREIDGIEVIYYRNFSNYLADRYRFCWPPEMFSDLASEIDGSDVIHIHELRSTPSVLAYRVARRANIPYVLSGHGGLRPLGRPILKFIYDTIWGRRILRHAAAIIAISPREVADAREMGVRPNQIQMVPNIVRSEDFQTLPVSGSFRRRWSIPVGRIVLFLARLHPLKGADLLVRAFSQLRQGQDEAVLVLAGPDDGQENELRRLVSKLNLASSVRLVGFLDLEGKKEAFQDASVVVVPSRSEVFAITAVEALLCGKPVLLSTACGLDPLPDAQGSVSFFEAENVTDLTNMLQRVIANDAACSLAARTAQHLVSRTFSPSTVAARAEAMYYKVLSRRSQ